MPRDTMRDPVMTSPYNAYTPIFHLHMGADPKKTLCGVPLPFQSDGFESIRVVYWSVADSKGACPACAEAAREMREVLW